MADSKRKVSTARKNSKKAQKKSANVRNSVRVNGKQAKSVDSTAIAGKSLKAESTSPIKVGSERRGFDQRRLINTAVWVLIVVFSFLLVDLLVQYLNNDYSVAVVNSSRLKRSEFNQRLEDLYGESIIDQMITEELVRQEGEKEGIEVSEDDIKEVVQETKDQLGGDEKFKEALEANNLSEEEYQKDVELRLMAQRLVVEEPNDEVLKNFFDSNKALYFNEEDVFEDVKADVEEIYYNQKFNELSQDWLDNLKEESEIQNNVEKKPKYGLFTTTRNIIKNITN